MSVGFAACGGDEVEVYRIAKGDVDSVAKAPKPPVSRVGMPDDHPPVGAGSSMQTPPPSQGGSADIVWTLPSGWTEEGGSGMRLATLRVGDLETTVIVLGGVAGGDFANANRWRGQIGLGDLTQAEFDKTSEFVQSSAGRSRVVDYNGESKRLLASMLLVDGRSWFFKMMGPKDAVGKAKPAFKSLLKSLKPKA